MIRNIISSIDIVNYRKSFNSRSLCRIENEFLVQKLQTLSASLTLSNMAQGIFTLAYMSHDHLHGSHAGLPMIERVNFFMTFFQPTHLIDMLA